MVIFHSYVKLPEGKSFKPRMVQRTLIAYSTRCTNRGDSCGRESFFARRTDNCTPKPKVKKRRNSKAPHCACGTHESTVPTQQQTFLFNFKMHNVQISVLRSCHCAHCTLRADLVQYSNTNDHGGCQPKFKSSGPCIARMYA